MSRNHSSGGGHRLTRLLPKELAFLISDQGIHFRSKTLAQLAQANHFVHIPIYRYRLWTNNQAERFVRTLKHELRCVLAQFLPAYNDRPYQGLPIPGLSPNEFAHRIWLM